MLDGIMRNNSIILNLGQWFKRCCLKDFLSGALVTLLFGGVETLMQFIKRGHHGEHSCEVNENWTSGLKKKFTDGQTADKDRLQGEKLKIEEFKGFSRPLNDFPVLWHI